MTESSQDLSGGRGGALHSALTGGAADVQEDWHGHDGVEPKVAGEGDQQLGHDREFVSLLSALNQGPPAASGPDRSFASDLHIDQIVESIAGHREESDFLTTLFCDQLRDVDAIHFRHEVFEDLQGGALLEQVKRVSEKLAQVRLHVAQVEKMRPRYQKAGWFLDAAAIYCQAVAGLAEALGTGPIRSRGLLAFRDFLTGYMESPTFSALRAETDARKAELAGIRYTVRIRGNRVEIRRYEGEADYSAEVEATFERFQQGAVKDYRVEYRGWPGMDHVGAQILELVARHFHDEFSALDEYCRRHADFFDPTIGRFDQEVQFYIAYLDYIEPVRTAGLSFCYPEVTEKSTSIFAQDTFDLALASGLVAAGDPVVCNEFRLEGTERIFVVSGPNQGGKTTFARTFGQMHHLASIGCLVPGSAARLFLFDRLFTHFEKEENLSNMSGKLEDDLVRIRHVLAEATSNSIVIMNEIFTSTTLNDARFLGTKIMERVIQLDLLCVYVTFVDEIAALGKTVVSMVSTVMPENPAERTYKVVRGPADGLAYALAIAEKYNLTYDRLRARIVP